MASEVYSDFDEAIEPVRVQVTLMLGFDDESEKALQIAWNVAQELLEQNIWVEIIPVHLWLTDVMSIELPDLPKIIINGKTMFIGRAPRKQELIDAILDRIDKPYIGKNEGLVTAARIFEPGFLSGALVIEA